MSIHITLGKPGAGKSLYATSRLIRELYETRRNIVTNLALNIGRLNEYLQQLKPDIFVDVIGRVRVLEENELSKFWEFRGPPRVDRGTDADNIYDRMSDHGDDEGRGVAYFLDEAHIAFNARDWATLGRGAIHYLSQHRKLGDVVFVITQSVGNLDKQFRSVAEDFTVLENQYTKQYSIFRAPGRFVRKHYYKEPGGNAEPYDKGTFTLDREGIASCYDTAKGIGVHGSKADIGRRATGIPIYWLFPAGILLCAMAIIIPWLLAKGVGGFISKQAKPEVRKASSIVSDFTQGKSTPVAHSAESTNPVRPVFVSSVVNDFEGLTVRTTDGRTLRGKQVSGIRYDQDGVTFPDGTWLPFKPFTFAEDPPKSSQ